MVQTDNSPPWFVIYGSNLKFIHWSYKRHLERILREEFDFIGTAIRFSFRDEKQIKANREKAETEAKDAAKALAALEAVDDGDVNVVVKPEPVAKPKPQPEAKSVGRAKATTKPHVKPNYKAKAITKAAKKPFKKAR
jgi:hypothetical protein